MVSATLTTIRTAGRRASSKVWSTQPSQRGLRGNGRTSEATHVIVNAEDSPGDHSGESRDERADGAQIRAFGPHAIERESAPHLTNPTPLRRFGRKSKRCYARMSLVGIKEPGFFGVMGASFGHETGHLRIVQA